MASQRQAGLREEHQVPIVVVEQDPAAGGGQMVVAGEAKVVVQPPNGSGPFAEVAQAQLRLQESEFRGEAIMKEYLSLLIDSDEFEDNARPGFLVNPRLWSCSRPETS